MGAARVVTLRRILSRDVWAQRADGSAAIGRGMTKSALRRRGCSATRCHSSEHFGQAPGPATRPRRRPGHPRTADCAGDRHRAALAGDSWWVTRRRSRPEPVALHRIVLGSGLGLAGAALIVVGTFLPWVGFRRRTAQQLCGRGPAGTAGPDRQQRHPDPARGVAVHRSALPCSRSFWGSCDGGGLPGIAAILVGLLVGAVATVVVVFTGGKEFAGVHVAGTGPWAVVAGAATVLVAGLLLVLPAARSRSGHPSGRALPPAV